MKGKGSDWAECLPEVEHEAQGAPVQHVGEGQKSYRERIVGAGPNCREHFETVLRLGPLQRNGQIIDS